MKIFRKAREYYYLLIKGRESPERIARGFAVGVFIAFNPLLGFHTILCIFFSIIFKASKTASILGSLVCNPFTIPVIYFSEYEVGKFFMNIFNFDVEIVHLSDFKELTLKAIVEFGKSIAYPICIGSIIFGAIFSIIAYIASKKYFKKVFSEKFTNAI